MKKIFTLLFIYSCLSACTTKADVIKGYTACVEPRPDICTMNYMPVCGFRNNKESKTYSNACTACADSEVISYIAHACEK